MKEKNNFEGKWSLKNHRSAILLETFCCFSYLQIQIYFCHLIPQGQSRPHSWPFHLVRRVHPLCPVILWLFLLRLSLGYFPPGPVPHSWWEYVNLEWQSCLGCTRQPDTWWGHPFLCYAWLLGSWEESLSWEMRGAMCWKAAPGDGGSAREQGRGGPQVRQNFLSQAGPLKIPWDLYIFLRNLHLSVISAFSSPRSCVPN